MSRHKVSRRERRKIKERRITVAITNMHKTGKPSDWLVRMAQKDQKIMRRVFPNLFPLSPETDWIMFKAHHSKAVIKNLQAPSAMYEDWSA